MEFFSSHLRVAIFLGNNMNQLKTRIIAIVMLALTSCALPTVIGDVLNDNSLLVGAFAYQATVEIIERAEDTQGRAGRILRYTDKATDLLGADEPVTIAALHQAIYVLIDWDSIPDIDEPLIKDLLTAIRNRLEQEVENVAGMTPETEVSLLHVVARIRSAADYYA